MPGIQDLITMAKDKLGVSADAATSGAGGLLNLIKQHAGAADFSKISGSIPGLGDILGKAPAAAAGGGGLLGKLGGMLGGKAASAGAVGDVLGKAGIGLDKIPGFVGVFVEWLKKHVSMDTLKGVLAKVGPLKDLLPKG
jgi:hypothetical protein